MYIIDITQKTRFFLASFVKKKMAGIANNLSYPFRLLHIKMHQMLTKAQNSESRKFNTLGVGRELLF